MDNFDLGGLLTGIAAAVAAISGIVASIRANSTKKLRSELSGEIKETVETALKPLSDKIDEVYTKNDLIAAGTITLLRDRMKSALEHAKNAGYATSTDRANFDEMFNSYKNLGGNHFREYVNHWKEEIDALPLEPLKKTRKTNK